MPTVYKALITDIDGTAVAISSRGEDVDGRTRKAIRDATRVGKYIACATGREWDLAEPVVRALGVTVPCIVEGGTRIVDPKSGETMWQKLFDRYASHAILDVFKTMTDEGFVMHSADTRRVPLKNVTAVPSELRFLYLLAVSEQLAVEITNMINRRSDAEAHFTPSWEGDDLVDIHVTHPKATKRNAIFEWQKMMNVTKAETIGMGDSGNDMPIFEATGLNVAVSNATTGLKELAHHIAPPVSEHALATVIEEYLV